MPNKSLQAIEVTESHADDGRTPVDDGYYKTRKRRWAVAVLPPEQPIEYRLYVLAETIHNESRNTIHSIVTIGRSLIEAQAILKENGTWVAWLREEFQWSHQTAYNFINVAHMVEKYPDLLRGDCPPSALYLLAGAPEEAVQEVLAKAEDGHVTKGKALQAVRVAKWREAVGKLVEADPGAALHEIEKRMNDAYYHESAVQLFEENSELFAQLSSEEPETVAADVGIPFEERYREAEKELPPGCALEENGDCVKVVVWVDGQPYTVVTFPKNLPPAALAYRNQALLAVVARLKVRAWEETL